MNVVASRATTVILFAAVLCTFTFAKDGMIAEPSSGTHSVTSSAATTKLTASRLMPAYVGSYCADGRFRRAADVPYWNALQPQGEVPPSIDRAPIEGVVQDDMSTPGHVVKRLHPQSRLGSLRDQIVTLVYGRQRVLVGPTHLVTDSRQRLIVTDPRQAAVHVLDGDRSFRIQGGPNRRFQYPNGVAVDAHDNIYITQNGSPYILVYDARGRYLRSLGTHHEEPLFQEPTGIAIDPKAELLYVLDSPMNELVVLDLAGDFVKRIGGTRSRVPGIRFDFPTEIVVRDGMIAVLDKFATRLQLLDTQGTVRKIFDTRPITRSMHREEIGLAMDSAGNVYVSRRGTTGATIYDHEGHIAGALLRMPPRASNSDPSGMWVDPADRVYVTDTTSGSIHVFERSPTSARVNAD